MTEPPDHALAADEVLHAEDLLLWRCPTRSPAAPAGPAVLPAFSDDPNPALAGGTVIASLASRRALCGVEATTGAPRWTLPLDAHAPPAVVVDESAFFFIAGGVLRARDAANAGSCWSFHFPPAEAGHTALVPYAAGGQVYAGSVPGPLRCFDAGPRGEPRDTVGLPAAHEGAIYALTSRGNLFALRCPAGAQRQTPGSLPVTWRSPDD